MVWASSEIVPILTFLLPGFVAGAVFLSLTSRPNPNAFGLVVQALIFTILGQSITEGLPLDEEGWAESWQTLVSVGVAVILAVIIAWSLNHDLPHRFLRYRKLGWLKITRETAYPSEWYSAFSHHIDCYVVLHLNGERRLYGWPEEWPSRPDSGHFRIAEPEWLTERGSAVAIGVITILVAVSNVEMVEFLPVSGMLNSKDRSNGKRTESSPE